MFFRREKPRPLTFEDRLGKLKDLGFQVDSQAGNVRVSRSGCAAEIANRDPDPPQVSRAGVLVGSEIGLLVDQGFQKTFQTPSGMRVPALAKHLVALHAFEEDLKEGLGLSSLYNESLGTENNLHLYDRVEGRDAAAPKPWQHSPR
jgi:hypothetical protein